MGKILKKSAQSVQDSLASRGLKCKVVVLADSTRTANDAASAIGCDEGQIVKSLIFKTKSSDQAILILASGPNRVKEKTIESKLGEKIIKADAEYVRQITGFAIGGIPPVGHKQKIEYIFIDEDLLTYDSVWAAAGTPHAVFNIPSADLLEVTKGIVISIK